MARFALAAILALAAGIGASACAKAQARTPAARPAPLEVPAPPARVVIPVTVKVPEPSPPTDPSGPPEARPPATAGTPPARPVERPAAPPGQQTPPVLQTTPNTAAIEQRTRDLLAAARRDLAKVERGKLPEKSRSQFDTASRFVRLAEEALAAKNYLFAQQLAESAAALAEGLVRSLNGDWSPGSSDPGHRRV